MRLDAASYARSVRDPADLSVVDQWPLCITLHDPATGDITVYVALSADLPHDHNMAHDALGIVLVACREEGRGRRARSSRHMNAIAERQRLMARYKYQLVYVRGLDELMRLNPVDGGATH